MDAQVAELDLAPVLIHTILFVLTDHNDDHQFLPFNIILARVSFNCSVHA